ncbi:hypothetical protein [Komarekiella delphini-convector]|uniref:hypothetical protein n=1 Tax=Komarekiella delphini-convector TaxID=3050158 RepID=UPI001CD8DF1A|nr:hypothetical protein [Komarekiella delphini-convector]
MKNSMKGCLPNHIYISTATVTDLVGQRGLLPKGEASAKGVSPTSRQVIFKKQLYAIAPQSSYAIFNHL